MHKFIFTCLTILLMSTSVCASAQDSHNHDAELVGQWFSSATDGSLTELQLQAGGKFVFDFRSGKSIERTYMCGTWERRGENVDLDIQASKSRFADGQIEQASSSSAGNFTVLSSSGNTLIIRLNQQVVSFHRTANT